MEPFENKAVQATVTNSSLIYFGTECWWHTHRVHVENRSYHLLLCLETENSAILDGECKLYQEHEKLQARYISTFHAYYLTRELNAEGHYHVCFWMMSVIVLEQSLLSRWRT